MKNKWNISSDVNQNFTGQPVGLQISSFHERWPRHSTLSVRAAQNYNSVIIPQSPGDYAGEAIQTITEDTISCNNYVFSFEETVPQKRIMPQRTSYSAPTSPRSERTRMENSRVENTILGSSGMENIGLESSKLEHNGLENPRLEYPRLGSPGLGSSLGGDTGTLSSKTGSTTKLVAYHKDVKWRCRSCFVYPNRLIRGISSISLAAGLGTMARLPAAAALHGGAAFLVAYAILVVVLGVPLVFLELGIGQIVQQGVTRTWRAVPMFRGVGYIKLVANMLLCIYYPLYIALALFYLSWIAKGSIPFRECAGAKMTKEGYRTVGISGEQCLRKTFLVSPVDDSTWFGIYVAFILLIWLIIMLCSFRRVKAYIRSMTCFFIPVFACMIALLVKAILSQNEGNSLYDNVDWSTLEKADVWYYATIQLFFSTHLGFGNVVTCAGKVYNKADPFWAAMAYMLMNIVLGSLSVLTCYILAGDSLRSPPGNSSITELHLFNAIYDQAILHPHSASTWTVLAYFSIFLSGFISLLAVVFTILKAIRVEMKNKWQWWQTSASFCFIFFLLATLAILAPDFKVVHILDHYVVGNLLLICTILEVGAFVYIYGCSNLYIDFEFILGSSLTWLWKVMWWLSPVILTGITVWALITVRLTGIFRDDPLWMYTTGWTIVVICISTIIILAGYEVYIQVDYNLVQKFMSALKPSRKWGPVDPMIRHGWIQWRSTAGTGDRDFTLKRRGTRDYTHSVKNRRYNQSNPSTRFVSPIHTNSDSAIIQEMTPPNHGSSLQNGEKRHTLEIVSITDTLDRNDKPRILGQKKFFSDAENISRLNMNPLRIPSMYGDTTTTDSNSEGYGTIRNGPYVIGNGEFDHVCWRKDLYEEATEL